MLWFRVAGAQSVVTRARGTGRIFQPTYRDATGQRVKAKTWAFTYYNRRKRKSDSGYGFRSRVAAEKALRLVLAAQDRGELVGSDVERTTFADLAKWIRADYVNNGNDSLPRLNQSLAHLERWFGEDRASRITDERVELYKAARLEEKAKPATVNRELAALRRMFKLARRRVPFPPLITMLQERNVRRGFFEEEQFRAVLSQLPAYVQPVAEVAYVTGWRVPSEVLTREWRHVDFAGGFLVLEPFEAKAEKPRRFPLDPQLRPILEQQRAAAKAHQRETGRMVPWVFFLITKKTKRVRRIKSFYKVWHSACLKAGIAGRIPHDFRRTAFRNLRRAGVDIMAAMELVGWSSFAMAKRYGDTDEAMLKEATQKLAHSPRTHRERSG